MKRPLLRSNSFVRAARRLIKKNPGASDDIRDALYLLAEDAFHPLLKTHKLKGKLEGPWACSAGYDLRIVLASLRNPSKDAPAKPFWLHRFIAFT